MAREHGLVNGGDLVREWLHIGGVDRYHGIEEEREIDPLCFDRELERISVAIEGPGALRSGDTDVRLIGTVEQPILQRAVRNLVNHLHRVITNGHGRNHDTDGCGFKAGEGKAGGDVFQFDHEGNSAGAPPILW